MRQKQLGPDSQRNSRNGVRSIQEGLGTLLEFGSPFSARSMPQRQNPISFGYRKPAINKEFVPGVGCRLSGLLHLLSVETEKFVGLHLRGGQGDRSLTVAATYGCTCQVRSRGLPSAVCDNSCFVRLTLRPAFCPRPFTFSSASLV